MTKRIDVVSLFPEMFDALKYGITGRKKIEVLEALQTIIITFQIRKCSILSKRELVHTEI